MRHLLFAGDHPEGDCGDAHLVVRVGFVTGASGAGGLRGCVLTPLQKIDVFDVMVNKGWVLYNLQRYAEARAAWEQAADRGNPNARRALESLREV